MNPTHLRALAYEKFIGLLMNRAKGDTRNAEQLRQAAARAAVRQVRVISKLTAASARTEVNASNAQATLINKILVIARNMNWHADRKKTADNVSHFTPTIDANPIIADEPVGPSQRRSKDDVVVTFPVVSGTGKQLIDDSEFPRLGMADEVSNNWRRSILENQERAKQRDIASARHRTQQAHRYVG
jgi:hypothetical protein